MKEIVAYDDFAKLDLRIGKVVSASAPDWSPKLLEMKVDFGSEIGEKTILSGIRKWYSPDDLVGKLYPFIVNLAERKMGQGISQGMMIMADATVADGAEGETRPVLTELQIEVAPGTIIR